MDLINEYIIEFINNMGMWGPLFCCFLIMIESMVPILPLFVFITVNFESFGYFLGFIISYICAIIGCLISFCFCRYLFKNHFEKKFRKNNTVNKLMTKFDNIKLRSLTIIVAIPFTPAFLINIAAGLSKISFKKYLVSILIGKISLVFFWGFIGTSLIDSLKNPIKLVYILLMLLAAYIISTFISKKFDIN